MDWKQVFLGLGIISVIILSGCTSVQMKRCPEKFQDADVLQCDDSVQGIYRDCKKPANLYKCTDPQ